MPRMMRSQRVSAAPFIPVQSTLSAVRTAAAGCQACDLWRRGTQTVFGEGDEHAEVMFIGEQPGDQEDRLGKPFVGPAGQVLDRALAEAGIDRRKVYVTNVVKHFKWEPKGKRRIHVTPDATEINACRPWLEAEVELIRPRLIVCLGATAAQALLGKTFRVTRQRGEFVKSSLAPWVIATIHPSAILRIPDDGARWDALARFVEDLKKAAAHLARTDVAENEP
jgi:uracil-DNA glycosylase family protein